MNGYAITRDKFFSVKEKKSLLRVCKRKAAMDNQADRRTWITRYMLIHLALHSGLRVSEIAALKIEDLRFNGKENYLVVQCGKRGKKRDVYVDQELVKHLQNYVEMKRKWGEAIDFDSPLFAGRAGGHYTTTALEISFKKAIREAKLPERYSIHSSRHTYATLLMAKTNNIRFVQKQLGHASISMTSLYADILPEMNQTLAETILK